MSIPKHSEPTGKTNLPKISKQDADEVARIVLGTPHIYIDEPNADGETLLHRMAEAGQTEMVHLLLEKGAYIDCENKWGATPLHYAKRAGHVKVARLLLEKGADALHADSSDRLPLHHAVRHRTADLVELLRPWIKKSVHRRDDIERTPMHEAAQYGCVKTVKLLLESGAAPNGKGVRIETPLTMALRRENAEVAQVLMNARRVNVHLAGEFMDSPLHAAARSGHAEIVKTLLSTHGADVNKEGFLGRAPLFCAARMEQTEVMKVLLAAPGIDVNKLSGFNILDTYVNHTPLHSAAYHGTQRRSSCC